VFPSSLRFDAARRVAYLEKPSSCGITRLANQPSLINSGAIKTRGAGISARTFLICGACFQNASRTAAKIFRRRNSAACW
jgi:hypothetical protein